MSNISDKIAEVALAVEAVKFQPNNPFQWASGFYMPIYNDNRVLLGHAEHRALVASGFKELIETQSLPFDVIAGTATAGIPPATTLADLLGAPLIYVRSKEKGHGLKNRIEGPLKKGQRVLVIEDVVSTGGSSVAALDAVTEAGGDVTACLAIYSYGFAKAAAKFEESGSRVFSLVDFELLAKKAKESGYLSDEEFAELERWREDPFSWGEKRGFSSK